MRLVEIYWNLHKNCWSVRDRKTGKVIAHKTSLSLRDAKFVVRQGGRKKGLKEKRNNVHAFVLGYITPFNPFKLVPAREVTYNPYLYDSFVFVKGKKKADTSSMVYFNTKGKVYAKVLEGTGR